MAPSRTQAIRLCLRVRDRAGKAGRDGEEIQKHHTGFGTVYGTNISNYLINMIPGSIPALIFQILVVLIAFGYMNKKRYHKTDSYHAAITAFKDQGFTSLLYLGAIYIVVRCIATVMPLIAALST